MNPRGLFTGKAFVVGDNSLRQGFDEEILRRILLFIDKDLDLETANIIDTNEHYDAFRIETDEKFFHIKLSFDPDCPPIFREEETLRGLNPEVGPKLIDSNSFFIAGETLKYLVMSWDEAPDLNDLGRGEIVTKPWSLSISLNKLKNKTQNHTP